MERPLICRVCIESVKRRAHMTPVKVDQPVLMQHPKNPKQWILLEDFREVPKGFVFDFSSIPRALWWLISPTELGDIGPLRHDLAYRLTWGTRKAADRQFLIDMEADKIPAWKRNTAYSAVRAFGWMSWGKSKVVIEELIPAN
jgi:hypothetical protein